MVEYTLVRSKRKTAVIYVRGNGVEVRAPLKLPKREIDRFVLSKEKWIEKRLLQAAERSESKSAFSLNYGGKIIIQGREYPIIPQDGSRIEFDGEAVYLPPGLTPEQIKYACVNLYRGLAKMHLLKSVTYFSKIMNVSPSDVKVNGAKKRWGSCSAKKSINFSWRLIMANESVIDYVVVHELAHLTEMNHSARFWSVVSRAMPDYQERRNQLRDFQRRLNMENWD